MLALVTGASSGIGRELARLFAADHDLILVARREAELNALADELRSQFGKAVHVFPADLGDPAAPPKLFDAVAAKGLSVDVLVNNAGFGWTGPFVEADLGKMLNMVQVNVTALTHLTGLFLPGMRQRGRGRILNVASTAAFQPGPLMAVYYATKAYVLSFSEALFNELDGSGVAVTCLCPGPTKTEFGDVAGMQETNLFNGPNVMSVQTVATAGYQATMRGKRLVVPGLLNKLLILSGRFSPRGLVLKLVRRFQEKRG
jgi:short-subunit dehydrogenase